MFSFLEMIEQIFQSARTLVTNAMAAGQCRRVGIIIFSASVTVLTAIPQSHALVFQSDFGLKDGAVSAMKGVAYSVDPKLDIFDITHEIPPFSIWEASYRLAQAAPYWPAGTVFVSVVDPGVGTDRKSVVAKSKTGHYFVTPDNGTLTMVDELMKIDSIREIDETANRLSGSELSQTFHGRDVYAYTGARLASGVIGFVDVGPELSNHIKRIPYQKAGLIDGKLYGNIPVLDVNFGNVWTNINRDLVTGFELSAGSILCIRIFEKDRAVWQGQVPFVSTFNDVDQGLPLMYYNSLLNISLALNMDNFAGKYGIRSGADWSIEISHCEDSQ